ncbi:helix-turn-helix domain-containing protein [Sphingomonas canadensis]|uniref:Helix-turn-helix domain-containing protein n=1 Tax=Sphingomonas canadensis TaxID=1219257 RepID=A0ABW3H362_9SPHN|nr:helix-turn-helix domain-containing protein [Sphingomonas canadensis]MCW3835632.1 helix-turn-helix domain-containing protein [Sphingomonas canadensis]
MQHFRTADCPNTRRAAYWNDIYRDQFAQVTFMPAREDFDAELRMSPLGSLVMADIRTSSTDIERTPTHINLSTSRLFSFLLLVRGSATFNHYGHEEKLRAGDFTLCDNAAPHRIHFEADSRLLLMRATPALLRNHLPCPEQLCGLKLPAQHGMTPTAAAMAQSIWSQMERGLPDGYGDRIAGHLLDMVTTAYSIGLGHRMTNSTIVGLRKARARQFIEERLQDPDLGSGAIAEGLRISPRYLRMLFADDAESVSAYILRRRLEECATQIASEGWRHLTITEIAFKWGFNSSAYFARAFRQRYGMTATEFRRTRGSRH